MIFIIKFLSGLIEIIIPLFTVYVNICFFIDKSGGLVIYFSITRKGGLMDKLKKLIVPSLLIAAFYLVLHIIEVGCPFKFITGISCPGCGMTRAAASLLQLDFSAAFYYHPLFPLVFVMAGLFLLRNFEKIGKKPYDNAIITICIVFIAVWVLRMIFGDGEIVSFHPENNIFARFLQKY